MEELVNIFVNNGVAIATIIYFMWRDSKFMSKLDTSLSALTILLNDLKYEKESKEND